MTVWNSFIGEESSAESKTKPVLTDAPTWIIDPIDGTTNFVHGLPIIGISVALAIKKEVVVGVVHNPVINQLYSAVKGKGAFLNGIPIHSSKTEGIALLQKHEFSATCMSLIL